MAGNVPTILQPLCQRDFMTSRQKRLLQHRSHFRIVINNKDSRHS
jgi:hypothetical protein